MNNIKINFDVSRGGIQHRIYVRCGDINSRTVTAYFYSGGMQIGFTSASLRSVNANGERFLSPCKVEGDAATYTFSTAELASGELVCEFVLRDGDAMLTSPRFSVICEELLYDGEGAVASSEYAEYIAALAKLENLTVSATDGEEASAVATVFDSGIDIALTIPRGKKPVAGVDYFTDTDKEEFKAYINGQIGNIDEALDGIAALQSSYMEGDR